jgi:deazaflavin-dependent oxidoreductase (nitroreductase family)
MFSGNTMIIHYTGRKSGKAYHLPVDYLRRNDTLYTVSYKGRTWWRNLRGGADVTVLLKGKMVPAHMQVFEDDQGVAEGLKEFIRENPRTARIFGIILDADGQPEPGSMQKAVRDRVIVRTSLT